MRKARTPRVLGFTVRKVGVWGADTGGWDRRQYGEAAMGGAPVANMSCSLSRPLLRCWLCLALHCPRVPIVVGASAGYGCLRISGALQRRTDGGRQWAVEDAAGGGVLGCWVLTSRAGQRAEGGRRRQAEGRMPIDPCACL